MVEITLAICRTLLLLIISLQSSSESSNIFENDLNKIKMQPLEHFNTLIVDHLNINSRGGSRTAATSKMERFVIIVNGWKSLNIITKRAPSWMLQQS